MEEVAPADRIPSVALIYNFRREYKDQNLEATLADHRAHCLKFNKRLLHSEVINTIKTKGVVLLWVGLSPDDDLVRQEMMTFMEEDPLIVKDIVDNWNIQVWRQIVLYIDLTPGIKFKKSPWHMLIAAFRFLPSSSVIWDRSLLLLLVSSFLSKYILFFDSQHYRR